MTADDPQARLWRLRYKPSAAMRLFPFTQTQFFHTKEEAEFRASIIRSLGGKVLSLNEYSGTPTSNG